MLVADMLHWSRGDVRFMVVDAKLGVASWWLVLEGSQLMGEMALTEPVLYWTKKHWLHRKLQQENGYKAWHEVHNGVSQLLQLG